MELNLTSKLQFESKIKMNAAIGLALIRRNLKRCNRDPLSIYRFGIGFALSNIGTC